MNQLLLPLLLIVVVAIPLVLGSRKQKRAAQEQQNLQSSLSVGDRVMTTSGLYGTVADTDGDTTIDIEIAPGVVTTWLRQAVREKVAGEVEETTELQDPVDDDTTAAAAEEPTVTATASDTSSDKDEEQENAKVAPSLEQGNK
jgi:preprotein translocase subunit YajC